MKKVFKFLKVTVIAVLCLSLSFLVTACGEPGEKGDPGVGIVSIAKTAVAGNVDTYTITLSNGNTTTFNVTNGVNGQDGEDGDDGQNGQNGQNGQDGVSITKKFRFQYRGKRYFAHRGLHRFQAERA